MASRFKVMVGAVKLHWRLVTYLLAAALMLAAIVYWFWVIPIRELQGLRPQLAAKDYIEFRNAIRTGLAQAIGGAAILGGLFFTWRNIRATERNLEITQATTAKNILLSQQGQITERFTHAIEQLGSDKLQIRLGGIYALERIARDSKEDHWPIMEILTAFVRANKTTNWVDSDPDSGEPPTDIQAVVSVLARRNITNEDDEWRIDLRGAQLQGASLIECHFERAILWGVQLQAANLRDAHLESAGLHEASFRSSALISAHLDRATMSSVDLEDSVCAGACFEGAQLNDANLTRAKLYDANLSAANLLRARLNDASLLNANLSGAILKDAIFKQADLKGADLRQSLGLTTDQVLSATNYDEAKLPPAIEAEIRNRR